MTEKRSLGRRISFVMISTVLLLIVLLIIGEAGFRVYNVIKDISYEKPEPIPPYNTAEKVDDLGWKPKSNYLFDGNMKDADDVDYKVYLTTDENGFRSFGKLDSERKKLFFLGDSYTQSVEVADDKVFYNLLKDSLSIDIFAYGMAGYGQVQEYMILDKYYDEIQPDVLILQVCSNDFIDNHHELEMTSGYKVGLRRPYLTLEDKIEYHTPIPTYQKIEKYSRFLGYFSKRWYNAKQNLGAQELAEKLIAEKQRSFEPYDYSIKITELALKKVKNRINEKTELIVYNADHYNPQATEFKSICERLDITYLSSPTDSLLAAEHNSITVRAGDGYHWNEKGHEVVAEALLKVIED